MSPQLRTRRDGSTRPARVGAVQPLVVVWLTLVWLAAWRDVTGLLVVSGVLVSVATCLVFPLPRLRSSARVRPLGLAALLGGFAVDLVRASLQVSAVVLRQSLHPARPLRSAVVEVDLASESDVVLSGVSILLSLIPGSVLVEARRSTHTLYLHVMDVDDEAAVARFRDSVLAQERRVLRAFVPRGGEPTSTPTAEVAS